jgi:hypothetical protein
MLHVSSFSSCTFSGTHIQNMSPWLYSMDHKISMDFSCASNELLSKDLFPLEVNWCQNFTLAVFTITFSYELCFVPRVACWISLSELFYLRCRYIVYQKYNMFSWVLIS